MVLYEAYIEFVLNIEKVFGKVAVIFLLCTSPPQNNTFILFYRLYRHLRV